MPTVQGKPLKDAEAEVGYGTSFMDWFGEEARRAYGDVIPSPVSSKRMLVLKQPIGVCGMITPVSFTCVVCVSVSDFVSVSVSLCLFLLLQHLCIKV